MSISTLTNQNTLTAVSQSATIASGATSTLVFNYPAAVGTFPVSFTGTSSNGTTTPNMIDIAADTLTAYSINTLPCDSAGGTSKLFSFGESRIFYIRKVGSTPISFTCQ